MSSRFHLNKESCLQCTYSYTHRKLRKICVTRLLLSNCLNWKINCDDHSSLKSSYRYFGYEKIIIYFGKKTHAWAGHHFFNTVFIHLSTYLSTKHDWMTRKSRKWACKVTVDLSTASGVKLGHFVIISDILCQ